MFHISLSTNVNYILWNQNRSYFLKKTFLLHWDKAGIHWKGSSTQRATTHISVRLHRIVTFMLGLKSTVTNSQQLEWGDVFVYVYVCPCTCMCSHTHMQNIKAASYKSVFLKGIWQEGNVCAPDRFIIRAVRPEQWRIFSLLSVLGIKDGKIS